MEPRKYGICSSGATHSAIIVISCQVQMSFKSDSILQGITLVITLTRKEEAVVLE
jgi:hypothetical protein